MARERKFYPDSIATSVAHKLDRERGHKSDPLNNGETFGGIFKVVPRPGEIQSTPKQPRSKPSS